MNSTRTPLGVHISDSGSPPAMHIYSECLTKGTVRGIRPTHYIQLMSHTVPANLSQFFGVRGRIITACSACTAGSQGIGFGLEAIQSGRQDVMICGGAEGELLGRYRAENRQITRRKKGPRRSVFEHAGRIVAAVRQHRWVQRIVL